MTPRKKTKKGAKKNPVAAYWDEMAYEQGASPEATAPDRFYRDLEISHISEKMKTFASTRNDTSLDVLDIGCGNGYSTIKLAKEFPAWFFTGIDISKPMIKAAEQAAKEQNVLNVSFYTGNVLSLTTEKHMRGKRFDIVFTERCLINLANFEEQKLSLIKIREAVKRDGVLILVENTTRGLENLNKLRSLVGLGEITQRWHNNYIPDEKLIEFLTSSDMFNMIYAENIGNMYYLISRVIGAKLAEMEGREPNYSDPINELAAKLPTFGEVNACSPNFLFILSPVTATPSHKETIN